MFHPDCDFDLIIKILKECNNFKKYWTADYYPLTNASLDESIWAGWQFHDTDSGNGMVALFRRNKSPYMQVKFHLNGIDKGAWYTVYRTDENYITTTISQQGESLINRFIVTIDQPRQSVMFEYLKQ